MTKSKVGAEPKKQRIRHAVTKSEGIHEGIHRDEYGYYDSSYHCYCFAYGYFFHRGISNAIDTAVSHNALVVLEETDPKDSHYSISIYEGMAHEIPNELLEREIFPITDVVGDAVGRLHIQLKTDFEAADNFLLFVQLPCITIKEKANNFIACEEDCGYIPHLYKFDSQYIIDWIGEEGDSLYCINGITPERVIRTAFKWCLDKGLITNPIYIK